MKKGKQTVKVCPRVNLDVEGNFSHISIQSYNSEDYVSAEYGTISYGLPELELTLDAPTEEEIRKRALEVLRANRDKLRADHQATMTRFSFMEGQLLRIGPPEVVEADGRTRREIVDAEDAVVKAAPKAGEDDDDIPF